MRPMAAAAALVMAAIALRALGLTAERSLLAASVLGLTAAAAGLVGVETVSSAAADLAYLGLVAAGMASVLGRHPKRAGRTVARRTDDR